VEALSECGYGFVEHGLLHTANRIKKTGKKEKTATRNGYILSISIPAAFLLGTVRN
jgi:hypothetical protein